MRPAKLNNLKMVQHNFKGSWLPDVDPAQMGPENFRKLENLRPVDGGLEAVTGYSIINTSAISAYIKIRDICQLQTDRDVKSHVLVHAVDSSGNGRVYENRTAIPTAGAFEGTQLHSDSSVNLTGRLSKAPQGHIAYCNGEESMIWAGPQMRLVAFFLCKDDALSLSQEFTEAVNNTLSTTGNTAVIGATDEFITNGNMEADDNWQAEGTPTTNEQSSEQAHSGTYSWKFTTDAVDEGIETEDGDDFTTVTDTVYYYRAWIYTTEATINVAILQGNDGSTLEVDTDHSVTASTWTLISGSYTETSGGANAKIQFRSPSADGIGTWYVDDVSIVATGRPYGCVFSTRPLQAVKFTLKTGSVNITKSVLVCDYWDGTDFAAVSSPSDATTSGDIALAQTGIFSFTSTVGSAKPKHFNGLYLYCYRFNLTAGSATIEHMSNDAPFQDMVDIWDGVYRPPIQAQMLNATKWDDYTLHINESSTLNFPVGMILDGLAFATDILLFAFEERMSGIRFQMLGGLVNTNTSVSAMTYWNGETWTTVDGMEDGTLYGGATFGRSGSITWVAPDETLEFQRTLFGTKAYFYSMAFNANLSGTKGGDEEVLVDIVTGIPAQQTIKPFKFAGRFKNRLTLLNYEAGKESNRIDYGMTDAPSVMNGEESSMNGVQSLYFGGSEALTAATEIYNRFGSRIFDLYLVLKKMETYVLDGNGPEDYVIYPVSYNVGCPAPQTLVNAEVGFEMGEDLTRNVAIWISYNGPVMFDGAVIKPLRGIQKYFDPIEDDCINYDYIDLSRAWFDAINQDYNLGIPIGSSTVINKWVAYNFIQNKWFEKKTGTANMPQVGASVFDTNGVQYNYGGIDVGQLVRLENGTAWNTTGITYRVDTGDFWPDNNIWRQSLVRHIKLVAKRISESHVLKLHYYQDSNDEFGVGYTIYEVSPGFTFLDAVVEMGGGFSFLTVPVTTTDLSLGDGNRLTRTTINVNRLAWNHGYGFEVTTTTTQKAFVPIAWGILYEEHRLDGIQ